jgi:hypothetical protein
VVFVLRQLAERIGDGVVVRLIWDDTAPPGRDVAVEYRDERQGVEYTLFAPRHRALDVFHHPNAYADPSLDVPQ